MLFVFKMVLILRSLKCFNNKICRQAYSLQLYLHDWIHSNPSLVVALDNIKGHCCCISGSSPKCFLHFVVWLLWCCCWTIVRLLVEYQYKIHIREHCPAVSEGGEDWTYLEIKQTLQILSDLSQQRLSQAGRSLPEKIQRKFARNH